MEPSSVLCCFRGIITCPSQSQRTTAGRCQTVRTSRRQTRASAAQQIVFFFKVPISGFAVSHGHLSGVWAKCPGPSSRKSLSQRLRRSSRNPRSRVKQQTKKDSNLDSFQFLLCLNDASRPVALPGQQAVVPSLLPGPALEQADQAACRLRLAAFPSAFDSALPAPAWRVARR